VPLFGVDVENVPLGGVVRVDASYLEEAVYLLQNFLESTLDSYYGGSFEIGRRKGHCYTGASDDDGQRTEERIQPAMLEHILKTAPQGADVTSWRY
jgi:hypothetical protein